MAVPTKVVRNWKFPVASTMLRLLEQHSRDDIEPLAKFLCYWMSLKSICATIAAERGCLPMLVTTDGQLQLEEVAGLSMPRVQMPTEHEQLEATFRVFSAQLKERLILHGCTRFFVNRLPRLEGDELTVDARGQRLNGVLDLRRTLEAHNPVWCPIDHDLYYAYVRGERTSAAADKLGMQILALLHTIGNNRFHGDNRVDYVSTTSVVERALPLLKEIVDWFVTPPVRGARLAAPT